MYHFLQKWKVRFWEIILHLYWHLYGIGFQPAPRKLVRLVLIIRVSEMSPFYTNCLFSSFDIYCSMVCISLSFLPFYLFFENYFPSCTMATLTFQFYVCPSTLVTSSHIKPELKVRIKKGTGTILCCLYTHWNKIKLSVAFPFNRTESFPSYSNAKSHQLWRTNFRILNTLLKTFQLLPI